MGCEQRDLSAAAPLSSAWVHQAFFSSSTVAAGRVQAAAAAVNVPALGGPSVAKGIRCGEL